MTAMDLIQISPLMEKSSGSKSVKVGLIDGPVMIDHKDFSKSQWQLVDSNTVACEVKHSPACKHGTFVAGILAANAKSGSPGVCPDCTFMAKPIFCEAVDFKQCPLVTPASLSQSINDLLDEGADVINMSLGLSPGQTSHLDFSALKNSYTRAKQRGVFIVAASGNYGMVGESPLLADPWIVPVAACDLSGKILPASSIGKNVAKFGVMAPGFGVKSVSTDEQNSEMMTGTSIAAPFVTGSIALILSLFPNISRTFLRQKLNEVHASSSIVPAILNVQKLYQSLDMRKTA